MPKPNYAREKRQRDLARQHKQEDKRQKRALKHQGGEPADATAPPADEAPASSPLAPGDTQDPHQEA